MMAVAGAQGVTIEWDFTYDNGWFAARPEAVTALEKAGDVFEPFMDSLSAIQPGGGNTWSAKVERPDTGDLIYVPAPVIAADTVRVYVGARDMGMSLGAGGPGGHTSSGDQSWLNTVAARGQAGALSNPETDFGRWGGQIAFHEDPTWGWHFNVDSLPGSGQSDFFSVAVHEMAHVLGFGTSDSWDTWVDPGAETFTGPSAASSHGGEPNLHSDLAHWKAGLQSTVGGETQDTALSPYLTIGTRKRMTELDFASLEDVGWELPLTADVDLDGEIGFNDAWDLLGSLGDGRIDHSWMDGDLDGDGDVDSRDADIMLAAWPDETPPAALMMAVPEPGMLVVVALGGLGILRRRTQRTRLT
jgi:hypothetical protein